MNPVFEMKESEEIEALLDRAEYGTLALCDGEGVPYAVPLNFVRVGKAVCFHGALKNRKMKILEANSRASFNVTESYALIDSDFSSTGGLACPVTQFFKSVTIDGVIERVTERNDKAAILQAMMEKLQLKGGYRPLTDAAYDKALKATAVYRLIPTTISSKYKFGQHLPRERFEMIMEHLQSRGSEIDRWTVEEMRRWREDGREE